VLGVVSLFGHLFASPRQIFKGIGSDRADPFNPRKPSTQSRDAVNTRRCGSCESSRPGVETIQFCLALAAASLEVSERLIDPSQLPPKRLELRSSSLSRAR